MQLCSAGDTAVDLQDIHWTARVAAQRQADPAASPSLPDPYVMSGMWNRGAQYQAHIQMPVALLRRDAGRRIELHHDVGMLPLRANEVARVRLALFQLRQYLSAV